MATRQYKRDLKKLELRRRKGMRMLARGVMQAEVARVCEVTRQTAMTWARMLAEDPQAWRRKPLGRPTALDERDLKQLVKHLLDGAVANGFPNELWTLARVVKLIEREFGVKYSVANVWHILRGLGFSSQRPAGRAIQRDEVAIKQWRAKRWPALKKSPVAKDAHKIVVAHLGNEASMCAMKERKHVANTADFSALESLPMATRCGALDPGVILYLLNNCGLSVAQLTHLLYEESGLLGVSGISGDMRELLKSKSPRATEAINLFVYRIGRELGSLAAALQGLDALVFTGGIGEHVASVRAAACRAASWLGIDLDEAANLHDGPRISTLPSPVSAWVIPTDEEYIIARHTLEALSGV